MSTLRSLLVSGLIALASAEATAVTLSPDGLGQALIYPYYTVRAADGNAFNTYVSVLNHAAVPKALRVRFREGLDGREVLAFNLYLSAGDTWAGAVVPTATGARLLSVDRSCTDPEFEAILPQGGYLDFTAAAFAGALGDGNGETADRTREGFIEIIEMATVTGDSAAWVTQTSSGIPASCTNIRSMPPTVENPSGGLSGTLTLINVASGLDFTLPAEALAALSTEAFYRPAGDPYPDFAASEITPVSVVSHGHYVYRSEWASGVDAVSAALMRSRWSGEYVLDGVTTSRTDVVVTFPTRHYHVTAAAASAPFPAGAQGGGRYCVAVAIPFANRESSRASVCGSYFGSCEFSRTACAAASVGTVINRSPAVPRPQPEPTAVLGSVTQGLGGGRLPVVGTFENGWIAFSPSGTAPTLDSLPTSQRLDKATGAVIVGSHAFSGLPVTGFAARSFGNGTLACTPGACQGNYGGAFPLVYERTVTP